MNWNDYSKAITEFCIYPDAGEGTDVELAYLTLGLASEAGEVAGLMKKDMRDQPEVFPIDKWESELGDCFWYLSRLVSALDLSLEDILEANYAKLKDRKERNVLGGSGDNR